MTTLAKNTPRDYVVGDRDDVPVIQSDIIYEGAAVGDSSGYGRPLVGGDIFRGFATRKADNAAGASGAINVEVYAKGRVQAAISSFDVTDVGKPVFMSDDDTFTLTQGTNSHVGRATRFVGTGTAIVAFDALDPAGLIAELTDSSGGTAAATLVAISATYVEAEIENNFASLAAKVNALLRQTRN